VEVGVQNDSANGEPANQVAISKERFNELVSSETRYRRLFEASQDGILILDSATGAIVDVNPYLADLLGFSRAEILGKKLWEIGSFRDVEASRTAFEELQRKEYIRYEDLPLESKDGRTISVEFVSNAYRANNHKVIQCNIRNITDRKRIAEITSRLAAIVESSDDAIISVTLGGEIVSWNKSAERIYGYSVEEIVGKNLSTLFARNDDDDELSRTLERIKNGVVVKHHQTQHVAKSGNEFPVSLTMSPIRTGGGEIIGVSAIARDISDEKRLEELRDRFISSVTHELRTPLVSIKGYADYALTQKKGALSDLGRRSLTIVKEQADRLMKITDDLLDYRKVTSGKFHFDMESMDLRDVIRSSVIEIEPFMAEKKQRLVLDMPDGKFLVRCDRTRLDQVMMNLLINASKFTKESGEVKVIAGKKDGSCWVSVSDNGIGIAKEDLERVFEPFAAIQKPTWIKGTGLGLSVTKALVEAHGGRVWAESAGQNQGATFTFTIPLDSPTP